MNNTTIYRPQLNKISKLSTENARYYALLLHRSKYSRDEIESTLADIEQYNDEWQVFQGRVYEDVLTDEDGEMNHISGFASDAHKAIHEAIFENDYVHPNLSQNSHANCFPVRTWQKDLKACRRAMNKIQKLIDSLS